MKQLKLEQETSGKIVWDADWVPICIPSVDPIVCGQIGCHHHADWDISLGTCRVGCLYCPACTLADGSQTGVKLSPQAIFEEGVMETKWRWQWTTPAGGALDEIPHLKVAHV